MLSIDDIALVFARRGAEQYTGEPVSHLQHALQCAHLAEQSGADDALVAACLLHDLGHLLETPPGAPDTPSLHGIDDLHQYAAIPWLRGLVGEPVLAPIRLHVDAKRWLCHRRPDYHARLSADSKRSLQLQGGVFDADAAAAFMAKPGARAAVQLRQWDDLAKQPGLATPSLAWFLDGPVRRVAQGASAAG